MQHLRRQYADQLVDGIGPAGRDLGASWTRWRSRPPGCATPRQTTAGGLGLHVPGLVRRQPARRPGRGARVTTSRRSRPAGPWATRCWSSRPSATSATTPTTTATTAGRVAAWEESAEAAARGGHVLGVLAQQLLLAVLARDAGDEAGARALAAETLAGPSSSARPSWPARSTASWPGWTPRLRRRRSPPIGETAVPYSGTAGLRDDGRSGDRLPWLHAPGPSRTHATRRLTQSSQRVTPRCPAQQRGFLLVEERAARALRRRTRKRTPSDERADHRSTEPGHRRWRRRASPTSSGSPAGRSCRRTTR